MKKRSMILLVALVALATIATATPIVNSTLACPTCVTVGGFQYLPAADASITSWNIAGKGVMFASEWTSGTSGWQSADGLGSVIGLNVVDPVGGGTNYGSVDQLLTGLTPGSVYTLHYWLSIAPGGKLASFTTGPTGSANGYGFKQVNILISGYGGTFQTYNYQSDNSWADMNWVEETFLFVAPAATATLTIQSATPDSYWGPAVDNVFYEVGGVPEPGTFSMLIGAALAGLAFVKFKK